ncbi:MAG: hypothetical protein ACM3UR_13095 [Bacteroidota bacterium]|jgi:hypothetical protein|nr:hypothetical protein [Ignavibacteria bacterium]MCU7512021.1 hypothetical protein [Ignavibacteria bacterium]
MLETDILTKALQEFKNATKWEFQPLLQGNDFQLLLKVEDYNLIFNAEVKQNISRSTIGLLKSQLNLNHNLFLLVVRYVNPEMAEVLRGLDINFMDTAGSAFIKLPPLYIDIQGRRLKEPERVQRPGRVFQPAGLQLIFTLLCNPRLEENPLREIAEYSSVGLTTVQKTLKGLEQQGFLALQSNKKYKLINKETLI